MEEIIRLVANMVKLVSMHSHIGIEANDKVDELVRSGAARYVLVYPSLFIFFKSCLKQWTLSEYLRSCNTSNTEHTTKVLWDLWFDGGQTKILRLNNILRIITGHLPVSFYLKKYVKVESTVCRCDYSWRFGASYSSRSGCPTADSTKSLCAFLI